MSKKFIGYSVFFTVLTALFLFFVFAGTDKWKAKSPVLGFVKPFNFTTQDSASFTEKNMKGKVCVVNFFFTTCKGICPRMNGNMQMIYEEFKNEPDFLIVSHTSDPERDSPQRLKEYANSLKVNTHKWIFLTGRKDSLYTAARNSYLIDDPKNNITRIEDQFLHTQFFALIDKQGNVRGHIYDGLKHEEINELKKQVRALLEES